MSTFHVGDKVKLTADFGQYGGAVPFGREGTVVETALSGLHFVVDFGDPYGERGCGAGANLEKLP